MVGPGIFDGLFRALLIILVTACCVFFTGGWLIGRFRYKDGYLQGQIDYSKGIINLQRDTLVKINLK